MAETIEIPLYNNMTIRELKELIKYYYKQGKQKVQISYNQWEGETILRISK